MDIDALQQQRVVLNEDLRRLNRYVVIGCQSRDYYSNKNKPHLFNPRLREDLETIADVNTDLGILISSYDILRRKLVDTYTHEYECEHMTTADLHSLSQQ